MYDFCAFSGNNGANFARTQAGRFSYAFYAYYASEEPHRTSISES